MAKIVTFQCLEGVDKGRLFRDLATPVTIGREEGNSLRLNDERISRYHAKVLTDQNDVILTDLDSTNGTRVNGNIIQIHRLRPGDCVMVGRSVLRYGTEEEIMAQSNLHKASAISPSMLKEEKQPQPTVLQNDFPEELLDHDLDFSVNDQVEKSDHGIIIGGKEFPPLPKSLTPSQIARLSEIMEFIHRQMAQTTSQVEATENTAKVTLDYATWQRILSIQMLIARYQRAMTEPD